MATTPLSRTETLRTRGFARFVKDTTSYFVVKTSHVDASDSLGINS